VQSSQPEAGSLAPEVLQAAAAAFGLLSSVARLHIM
jgi:hypothetical protein